MRGYQGPDPGEIDAAEVLRGLTAAGVFMSAVIHFELYQQGYRYLPTIGPLFLTNFVAGVFLGLLVLVWRNWLPALLAAGYALATVVAYWISVVHGLFGLQEVTDGWAEILAEVAEYVAIACGVATAVLTMRRKRAVHADLRPGERQRTALLRE